MPFIKSAESLPEGEFMAAEIGEQPFLRPGAAPQETGRLDGALAARLILCGTCSGAQGMRAGPLLREHQLAQPQQALRDEDAEGAPLAGAALDLALQPQFVGQLVDDGEADAAAARAALAPGLAALEQLKDRILFVRRD